MDLDEKMSEVSEVSSEEPQPSCSWHNTIRLPSQPSCSWQKTIRPPSPPSYPESLADNTVDESTNFSLTDIPDWQSKYESVTARNALLLNNSLWSDMEIYFPEENLTIPAHLVIIAPASSVLSEMIEASQTNTIQIIDPPHNMFMDVLRYIYTDFLEITIDNACAIMTVAKSYKIKYLEQKCINVIAAEINVDNVCSLFNKVVNDNVVSERCLNLIKAQTREIINHKSFLNLNVDKLREFLEIDCLNVNEKELYDSCLCWADNACKLSGIESTGQNKRNALNKCELLIRFPTMDTHTFIECVRMEPHFFTKEEIGELNKSIIIGANESQFLADKRNSFNKTTIGKDHVSRDVSTITASDYFYKCESDGFEIKPNCEILLKGFGIYGLLVDKPEEINVTLSYTVFEPKVEQQRIQEKKLLCDGTSKIYPFMLETPIEYRNLVYNSFIFEFDIGGRYYCNSSSTCLKDMYNVLSTKKYGNFNYYRIKEIYFDTI